MPEVKVNDIDIYYETRGEGEPLVLVMGLGGTLEWWFLQVPALSQYYRVVAFDNRGSGRSDKPDIPYTMEMMAKDTIGLMDALGIPSARIFGISMGGMIAQHIALLYPQRVKTLILGATTCGGSHSVSPDPESMKVLFDMERMQQLSPEERFREMLPFIFSREFIEGSRSVMQELAVRMSQHITPPHGYMRQAQAIMGHDTYERLPDIKAPTLVIAAEEDRIVPVENSRIIASRIPGAELVLLKRAGHGFNIELADEVNKAVLDFLRRHRARSRA